MHEHLFHSPTPSPSRSRPTIVFGGTCGLFGSAQGVIRRAQDYGYFAVDLDLRHALCSPSSSAVRIMSDDAVLRIRSIWLPATVSGPLLSRRLERLTGFLRLAQQELGLRNIIIAAASPTTRRGTPLLPVAREAVAGGHGAVRLAMGVRADRSMHSLESTALARRVAEEWNLDLALDVAGPVPAGWEAEAAVSRLLPRLAVVRLCGWLPTQLTHQDNGPLRIAARSMAMLADQGYAGLLSVVPTRGMRALAEYQHDLQRRYEIGPYNADSPARTYFDLP
jgi:hypothetical protein